MKETLLRLVAHMEWADQQVQAALRATAPAEALRWYAHVVGAERVWLLRLENQDWTVQKVWPELTLDACAALARENATRFAEQARRLTDAGLAREVTYVNSAGETFTSAVADILLHVALHGAHHRGQIAASLRRAGGTPPVLDYIRFVREFRA